MGLFGKVIVGTFAVTFALQAFMSAGSPVGDPVKGCIDDSRLHSVLRWGVKESLRDPDSFEGEQFYGAPPMKTGVQTIRMEFRARNGFGGMNMGVAEAQVSVQDCKVSSWKFLT